MLYQLVMRGVRFVVNIRNVGTKKHIPPLLRRDAILRNLRHHPVAGGVLEVPGDRHGGVEEDEVAF